MATLKEFEDALKAAGNSEALTILQALRDRDRASRSIRPARRVTGRKMTPELAAQILYLHRSTEMTQQEIAFQLSVNQGRVNEVIKRGKWLDGDPSSPEAVARDKARERAEKGVGVTPRRPSSKTPPPGMGSGPRPAAQPPQSPAKPQSAKPPAAEPVEAVAAKPAAKPKKRRPSAPPAQLLLDGL